MALPTPSLTLYVSNLETKTKKPELRSQLYALFNPYGRVIDVVAKKHDGGRGQAFVVFEEQAAATAAMRALTGEMFYERDLRITYARAPSHATIERADPDASREAAAIRAAKMTVSNAQGEYEQLEREKVEEDLRLAGNAMGKRELEEGEEGPAGKRVKQEGEGAGVGQSTGAGAGAAAPAGDGQKEEEEEEMEMEMEMDDDEGESDSGVVLRVPELLVEMGVDRIYEGAGFESEDMVNRVLEPVIRLESPSAPVYVPSHLVCQASAADSPDAAPSTAGRTLICSNLPPECNGEIMGALFGQYPGFQSAAALPASRPVPASHPAQNPRAKAFTIAFETAAQAAAAAVETKGYLMQPGWEMGVSAA